MNTGWPVAWPTSSTFWTQTLLFWEGGCRSWKGCIAMSPRYGGGGCFPIGWTPNWFRRFMGTRAAFAERLGSGRPEPRVRVELLIPEGPSSLLRSKLVGERTLHKKRLSRSVPARESRELKTFRETFPVRKGPRVQALTKGKIIVNESFNGIGSVMFW